MVRYKMLGRDVNSAPTQYRTWVVPNTPDFTGALYTGLKSGPNMMVDITAYEILDDAAIVDFDLPLATQWTTPPATPFDFPGKKVLPAQISDSALVIIDDFAYLFGGKNTNKIYQASLNNPANWIDSGATLPTNLYNSSLAIVDNTIYLFGGNDGNGSVSTIFSAPVSNPLAWTNLGSLLPQPLDSSSLGMADGYLYLFGGRNGTLATNVILTAPITTPTVWHVSGSLPTPLYGSTIYQANNKWFLLGGELNPDTPTKNIYSAALTSPFSWVFDGYAPYLTSYGSLFSVGGNLYYMGPSPGDAGTGFTTIIQASLNTPTIWQDTGQTVPAVLSHSQSAIIYDRLWFFGGSGLSAIFACEQQLKYAPDFPPAVAYGFATRTLFQETDNATDPFQALGTPAWKTDYTTTFKSPTLWAVNSTNGQPSTLYRLDYINLNILNSYVLPSITGNAQDMTFLNGFLWVLCDRHSSGTVGFVVQVDPATGNFVNTITLPSSGVFRLNSDGVRFLYASHNNNSGTAAFQIDTQLLTAISTPYTLPSPATQAQDVVVDPGTGKLFQADGNVSSSEVWRISPDFSSVVPISIHDANGTAASFTMLSAAGSIWASAQNSTTNVVKRIDPVSETVIATINASTNDPSGFNITDLKYNSKHNLVFVSYDDTGKIDKIDPNTNVATLVNTTPPGFAIVSLATYSDYLWSGEDNTGTVSVININNPGGIFTRHIDPSGIIMVAYTI